ncbi:MAG: hypothetical protein K0Q59_5124, partial [Paenibacillus sp.]|nr:hypothetical protein [Paenibacillus sp.]
MSNEAMSRRQLLATLGAAGIGAIGATMATTGIVTGNALSMNRVTGQVYGDGEELCDPTFCTLESMFDLVGRVGGRDGEAVVLLSYRPGTGLGGGLFYWDSARSKSAHNGGAIVSPTVPLLPDFSNLDNYLNGVGETDPTGSGCWVRPRHAEIPLEQFGIDPTGLTDSYTVIMKAAAYAATFNGNPPGQSYQTNVGATLVFPRGSIRIDSEIVFAGWGIHLRGHGRMTRICNGGSFSGEAYFRFYNAATYLTDVSCRDIAFDGRGLAVKGVIFQRCRNSAVASGLSGQYMGGALVKALECDMWLIDDIFFIPLVSGASANGVEIIDGNEGVLSRAKLFGWNNTAGTEKTNGSAVYIENNEEVKLFA